MASAQYSKLGGHICNFLVNCRGNVAMIFGITALPLLLTIGMAIDFNNQTRVQQRLAAVADAVALAASQVTDDEELMQATAASYLAANGANALGEGVTLTNQSVSYDPDTKLVTVELSAAMNTNVMGVVGIDHLDVSAKTVTGPKTTAGTPVSLTLVLDVSGSMDWFGKIDDLKTAATSLLDQLAAADTQGDRLRTGLVTYNSEVQDVNQMDWGITHTRATVQTLTANGGTSSTKAMNKAKKWLTDEDEENAHLAASGEEPLEFVIFMTDGDNNYSEDDTKTKNKCDALKAADVQVFTVAFEAPSGGQALLEYCASSEEHYFDAQNSEEFLEAFDIILEQITTSMLRIVE